MSSAYHRLSLAERQALRESWKKDLLFMMLYPPLWHQRGNDLSPEDVWAEALLLAKELHGTNAFEARIRAAGAFEDLCEGYSGFESDSEETTIRNEASAMHSAMMVMLTAFFMLLNEAENLNENPNRFICKALKDVVSGVEGFRDIYEGARREEDALEYSGRFIEAYNILEKVSCMKQVGKRDIARLHEVMGILLSETKKSSLPTMKEDERNWARANDATGGAIAQELKELREAINKRMANKTTDTLSMERVATSIDEVQQFFWAQSSWAVVFCVCRDKFGGTTNISQFERDVQEVAKNHCFNHKCPTGTISRTISNNAYMNKHVDKWEAPDVPKRVLSLKESLISAMENTN